MNCDKLLKVSLEFIKIFDKSYFLGKRDIYRHTVYFCKQILFICFMKEVLYLMIKMNFLNTLLKKVRYIIKKYKTSQRSTVGQLTIAATKEKQNALKIVLKN